MPKKNNLYNDIIQKHLTDLVTKGNLKPGDRLPSERDLARQFNTSNTPVRQATDTLVAQGLLVRMPGKGTFVRKPDTHPKPTGRLAILYLPDRQNFFASSFYSQIFAGIDREANTHAKDLILRPLQRTPDDDPGEAIRRLVPEADGFIIVDAKPELFVRIAPTLRALNKPVVLVNYEDTKGDLASVTAANVDIARAMTSFLIRQGHTRIGFCLSAPEMPRELHPNAIRRLEGYRLALLQHDLPQYDRNIISTDESFSELAARIRRPDGITAVYFPYDTAAQRFLATAPGLGISVPDDVSVVGSIDMRESAETDPALTSMAVPLAQLGAQAVTQLLSGSTPGVRICVPGRLIERASHRQI